MAKTTQVEVWVAVDANGDHTVAAEQDDLDLASLSTVSTRVIKVVLNVPLPVPVTLTGTVPAEGEATLTVAS